MAECVLHCAGCNVNFRAKTYDPNRDYKCPKCGGRLKPKAEAEAAPDAASLDSGGQARPGAASDPLVGTKIGEYKILKKLGEGGMGAVYQAVRLDLGRTVALKILPPKLAQDDPDALERFKREARSAAVLDHPNVVIVYHVGSEGKHHFIEMQYVDGQSLQQRLEREGKLPVDDATRIVQDAAGALAAAHKQNIIHRDIKPANIMLTSEGQVKVMDFGLAKDVTGATQLTVSGHIMGTPYYMSPEQCLARKLDARSDIYSLGATYYHLLAGSFPYSGDSLLEILRQHTDAPIPQLCDAPACVQGIIDRSMAKKPEDRFQTMNEFASALAEVAQPADRPPSGGTRGGQDGAGERDGTQRGAAVLPGAQPHGAQPPSAVDRGRDAEAAEGRSHRVPGSAATMAPAGLDDVIDTAAERDRHLHTRRIDHRLKDVRAFAKHWASLSDMVQRARKKGKPSDKQMREFADVRDIIARRYAEVMKRLDDPTTPGHRVVSACKTGAALSDILELPDGEYAAFVKHLDAGGDLLRQYVDFLDAGKRDLLKQSVWYFYWDKYLHNPKAAAAVLVAGVVLACVIGWQVAVHWPKGKKTSTTEVTESTEGSTEATTKGTKAEPKPTRARILTVRQDGGGDFRTIEEGLLAARDGDVVEIQDSGVYLECDIGDPQVRGERGTAVSSKRGLTLRGADGCFPRIGAWYLPAGKCRAILNCGPDWTIENVLVVGAIGTTCVRASQGSLTVRNCAVFNASACIEMKARASRLALTDSVLFTHPTGILAEPAQPAALLVENSTFFCCYTPIRARAPGKQGLHIKIRNCIFAQQAQSLRQDTEAHVTWDTDYNCYRFGNTLDASGRESKLAQWRAEAGSDMHSREDLSPLPGYLKGDLWLPEDTPCRGAGLGGADMGPRWPEWRFLLLRGHLIPDHLRPAEVQAKLTRLTKEVIIVSKDGTGDFTRLEDALAAVPDGGTVEIADAGQYLPAHMTTLTDRRLTIRARKGTRAVIGHWYCPYSLFDLRDSDVTFEQLDFLTSDNMPIRSAGGRTHVVDCSFSNSHSSFYMGSAEATVRNCVLYRCACVNYGQRRNAGERTFENNLVILSSPMYFDGPKWSLSARNNLFAHSGTSFALRYADTQSKWQWDYNCYWETTVFSWRGGQSYPTIDLTRKHMGNDKHSIAEDPKFADPENMDLRLGPDSPCRGAASDGGDIGVRWSDEMWAQWRKNMRCGDSELRKSEHKAALPPGFDKGFMLPDSDKDQHGNPVVTRNGSRFDPTTGWPYEVWCRVRTAHQEVRMEFVLIPAGEFLMGSSDEEIKRLNEKEKRSVEKYPDYFTREGPQHRVGITKPFYLAKYETTVAQFRWFVDKTGYRTDAEKRGGACVSAAGKPQKVADAGWQNPYFEQGDQNPVACVSWNDATAFCKALVDSVAVEVALPTEAQWEYACRAGSTGQFCYGDDPEAKQLGEYAWYGSNSGRKTHPVGQKRPNQWGLYDMHGNVWEWCQDWYGDHYGSSVGSDPRGPSSGTDRVVRGGSWSFSDNLLRSAVRVRRSPGYAVNYIGLRCVLAVR